MSKAVLVLLFAAIALVTCVHAQSAEDRAVAAIVGAFVADAAAMPLHWIYNVVGSNLCFQWHLWGLRISSCLLCIP